MQMITGRSDMPPKDIKKFNPQEKNDLLVAPSHCSVDYLMFTCSVQLVSYKFNLQQQNVQKMLGTVTTDINTSYLYL